MPGGTHEVEASSSGYDGGMAGTGLAESASARESGRSGSGARRGSGRWLAEGAFLAAPGVAAMAAFSYELARPSLWRDEAYTVDAAHRSLPQILALLTHTDAVNSAYYLVMHPVIALAGASATALRLPSALAMAVAAIMTAVLGRRLAQAADLPAPAVTGVMAALILVALPQATRYAQEARSYALVTMCATIATYLLLRALEQGRRRWWAGYGVAVAAMGLFNLLSLALLGAHAVTLAIVRARLRGRGSPPAAAPGQPQSVQAGRWLAAVGGALAVLSPLIATGMSQSHQIGWLTRPGLPAVSALVRSFAGSKTMLPIVAVLVLGGVAASFAARRSGGPLDLAVVAAPWLVLPPAALLAVSQVHPIYDSRYVVYCLPALALLVAGGLAWLTKLAMATALARRDKRVAWAPAIAVLGVLAALAVVGPQRSVRLPGSRPDNLRLASAVVAANERPGDAVMYLPTNKRVVSMGYPAPFRSLWDVALAKSPVAAGNLIGTEVSVPVLRQRFARVGRIWVITSGRHVLSEPKTATEKAKVALLASFHLVRTWRAGLIHLSLYARG